MPDRSTVKPRDPCFGCPDCVREEDSFYISYVCKGRTKGGRELYRITVKPYLAERFYEGNQRRETPASEFIDRQIKNRMRPRWCPREKNNENSD